MNDLPVFYSDSANLDAFGYLRVGQSQVLFDSKQIKNKQPLNWDDVEVSGSGTSSTYVTDTASTVLGVSANTALNATTLTGGTILDTGVTQESNDGSLLVQSPTEYLLGSTVSGTSDFIVLAVQRLSNQAETFYGSLTWLDQQ